jgi:hypothetical protein
MARLVFIPLLVFTLFPSFARAEDQDATATVKPTSSREAAETELVLNQSIDHLLRVADHLERAGHSDEAARVRAEARNLALKDNVLARKEAELECLQEEVNRLRNLAGTTQTIQVRLIAMEVTRSRLGKHAAEFDRLLGFEQAPQKSAEPEHQPAPVTLLSASRIRTDSPLFEELKSRKAITILAEPTIITTNGRPASFASGGKFAIPLPRNKPDDKPQMLMQPYGIQMEIVPQIGAGGRIRLQTRFEHSERDWTGAQVVDGTPIPNLTTRGINLEVEALSGQTIRLGCLRSSHRNEPGDVPAPTEKTVQLSGVGTQGAAGLQGEVTLAATNVESEKVEFIVLITPELVQLPAHHMPLQPVPAEEEIEILRKVLVPNKLAEDLQYFPATPIYRKGTRR